MQVFRLIIISLCLALLTTNAHAGFFDDLFGNKDVVELQPYSVDFKDIDGAETIVSHDEKVLKLKIFYPKADLAKVTELTNPQLNAAVQDVLTVSSTDSETGYEIDLGDLDFALRFKQVSSKDDNFYEMQFLSQGMTLDTPQRLDFSFNAKQFTRLLNLGTDPNEDRYTDKIYVKPIVIDLVNPVIDCIVTILETASALNGYALTATLTDDASDPILTTTSIDDIAFTYKVNGKSKIATARSSIRSKVIALTPSADSTAEFTTLEDANTYSLLVPITIDSATDLVLGRSYKARIPLQIETQTESGLKVLLRGIAKGEVIN